LGHFSTIQRGFAISVIPLGNGHGTVGVCEQTPEPSSRPGAAFLARFRAHLGLVEKAMGGLLVLTGVAFLTGAITQASFWLLDTFPMLGKIG
jgi:hypothetical protein